MSEDAKNPPAGEAAGAEKAAVAAKPRATLPPFVVPAAVIVLALGAGAAAGSFLLAPPIIHARQASALADAQGGHGKKGKKNKKGDSDKKSGKEGEGKTPVYKLDNIVVNPADSQGQRFLMCSVAIESDDAKALDELRAHEIELRDKIVSTLAARTLTELTAPGARDSLRQHLLATIKPVLGENADDADLKVYLPQFVIQ